MRLELETLSSRAIHLNLGHGEPPLELQGSVDLEGGLVFTQDGTVHIRWTRGMIAAFVVRSEGVVLRVERLELAGGSVEVVPQLGTRIQIGSAIGHEVVFEGNFGRFESTTLHLPQGLTLGHGSRLAVPSVELPGMRMRLAVDRPHPGPHTEETTSPPTLLADPARALHRWLDALEGRVEVDLELEAAVPILHRRKTTHHFALELEGGTLDYRELERGLAWLEDAVIDFELEDDRLILEKDLPIIPFDNQTLISWTLDETERRLAERGRVRLARLAQPDAEPPSPSTSPPSVTLIEAKARLREISLRARGPVVIDTQDGGSLRFGTDAVDAIPELKISGEILHRPGGPAEPRPIEVRIPRFVAAMSNLGPAKVSLEAVDASSLEAELILHDLTPMNLAVTLGVVRLRGLTIGDA